MKRFFRFVLDKKGLIIAMTLILSGLSFLGVSRIYIDNDVLHWFSRDSDIARLNYYINEKFKSNNPIVIMVSFEDDFFKKEKIELVRKLSKIIGEDEGIVDVFSITEAEDIKSTPEGIVVDKLLPDGVTGEKELEELRNYVMSREAYKGTLISRDGKSVNIIALPDPEVDASLVGKRVRDKVERFVAESGARCRVFFGGAPMILNSISSLVIRDISKLVPLVSIVVLTVLFLSFRNWVGTLIPLSTVLISCAIGMGIMGYLGFPLTTFGVAIPVVLIAVGNAYAIHVINEYYERIRYFNSPRKALLKTLLRVFVPVLMSGLTTVASFVSIGLGNEMITTKNFATISSIGISVATLLTLSFVPAILSTLKERKHYYQKPSKPLYILGRITLRYKTVTLTIFLSLALAAIYFLTKVKIEVDYLSYFDENTEPRKVTLMIAEAFDGSFEIKTYFKGNVQDPNLLKVMQIIEEKQRYFLGGRSKPQSIVEIVAGVNDGMVNIKMLPDSEHEVQNLWFFLEGKESVNRVVSEDKSETIINLLLGKVTSSQRYELIDMTEKLIEEYSHVELIPPKECPDRVSALVSEFLYNRLSRAGVEVLNLPERQISGKEEITKHLNVVVKEFLIKNLREQPHSYEERRKFVNIFLDHLYLTLGISENVISRKDLEYAISPSVWNLIPVPSSSNNGIKVFENASVTGIAKLFADMEEQILRSQLVSLGIIIFAVMVMNYLAFLSLPVSILSLMPIIFTLLINFGVMGLLDIKMDFITVTIASISVGVGIDYTIHFISRYIHEVRHGRSYEEAFYKTLSTTGKGILSNAFAVGLGFATLLFSSILPLKNFGLMMFITMLVSSFSALTLLPIVIIALRKKLNNSILQSEKLYTP